MVNEDRRSLFFKVLGIEDDGREVPVMTREEFAAFGRPCKEYWLRKPCSTLVPIYLEFSPHENVIYYYCHEDDTVYESRFYR